MFQILLFLLPEKSDKTLNMSSRRLKVARATTLGGLGNAEVLESDLRPARRVETYQIRRALLRRHMCIATGPRPS